MKELTIEQKAKAYDEALERARNEYKDYEAFNSFRNMLVRVFPELKENKENNDEETRKALINFLKSPFVNENITDEKVAPWIDWLEEQGQKPADREYTFKAIPRLLEMIEPTNRAKAYCQKLIDSLIKEGYVIDAMIVGECLKQMNGEDVPMATMDEQKPYGQRKECLDCQFNYAGECKGSCQIKRDEQKPIEWKQENREELTEFENAMMHIGGSFFGENAGLDPNDTAAIKEQAELLLKLAPKQEWSEEDENCLSIIIAEFSKCSGKSVSKDAWMRCNDFLNSLRDRVYPQNHVDKVELKFKVGDWIVNNISKDVFLIKSTNNGYYTLEDIKGNIISPCLSPCEDASHPWTIQDAKDGDVLFAENFDNIGGCVFLFKGLDSWKFDAEGDRAIATGYCCTSITESGNTDFGIQGPDCVEIKRVHPATKEQRDTLFAKMKKSGYKWDAKKKELKLLITNGGDITGEPDNKIESFDEFAGLTDFERTLADICIGWIGEEPGWKQYIKDNADVLLKIAIEKFNSVQDAPFEQKSVSEKDEQNLNVCLSYIPDEFLRRWLKDAIHVKYDKTEWGEEDENMVRYIGNAITCRESAKYLEEKGIDMIKAHRWLESFKPQSNQEWSEEDEEHLNSIISDIKTDMGAYPRSQEVIDIYNDDISFLKSLKNRIQPQNLTITDEELAQARKDAYNEVLDKIEYHDDWPTFDDGWDAAIWYLKKRNITPQSQWKPSKKQMYNLHWLANVKLGDSVVEQEVSKDLNELYEDLKKL